MAFLRVRSFPHIVQVVWFFCNFIFPQGDRESTWLQEGRRDVEITKTFLGRGEKIGLVSAHDEDVGWKVSSVVPKSQAACQHIKPGMVIDAIDGTHVSDMKNLDSILAAAMKKETFTIVLKPEKGKEKEEESDHQALMAGALYELKDDKVEEFKEVLKVDETSAQAVRLQYTGSAGCNILFKTDDNGGGELEENEALTLPMSNADAFQIVEPLHDDDIPDNGNASLELRKGNPRTILLGDFKVEFPFDKQNPDPKPIVEFWIVGRYNEAQHTRSLSPPPADPLSEKPASNLSWPEAKEFEEPYLGEVEWKNVWYRLEAKDKDTTLSIAVKNGDQVIGQISLVLDVLQTLADDAKRMQRIEKLPDGGGQITFDYYFDRRSDTIAYARDKTLREADCEHIAGEPEAYTVGKRGDDDFRESLACPAEFGPTFLMKSLGKCVCRPNYCLIEKVCTFIGNCEKTLWKTGYSVGFAAGFEQKTTSGKELGLQCKLESEERVCPALGEDSNALVCDSTRDFSCNCPPGTCLYEKQAASAEGVKPICLGGPATMKWEKLDLAQHHARMNPGSRCVLSDGAKLEDDPCDHWLAHLGKFYCDASGPCTWSDPIAEAVEKRLENELGGTDSNSMESQMEKLGLETEAAQDFASDEHSGKCIGGTTCENLEQELRDSNSEKFETVCKTTVDKESKDFCQWVDGEDLNKQFLNAIEENLASQLASKTAKDFHPGKYVIVSEEGSLGYLPVQEEVNPRSTRLEDLKLHKGMFVHVAEVCKTPVDGYIRARIDKLHPGEDAAQPVSGWINLKPAGQALLYARPTQVFPLGNYVVLVDNLAVTNGPEGDAREEKLPKGSHVQVTEVAPELIDGDIRAAIKSSPPGGWISLKAARSTDLYAEPQNALPPVSPKSPSNVEYIQPQKELPQTSLRNSSSSLVQVNSHSVLLGGKLHHERRAKEEGPDEKVFTNAMLKVRGDTPDDPYGPNSPLRKGVRKIEDEIEDVKRHAHEVQGTLKKAIATYSELHQKTRDIDYQVDKLQEGVQEEERDMDMNTVLPFGAYDRNGGYARSSTPDGQSVQVNPKEGTWDLMKEIIRIRKPSVGGDLPTESTGLTEEDLKRFAE